jgi:pimeloyl-ACP methyl ester carboxylesterase
VLLVTPFVTAAMYFPARQALAKRFRVTTVELPGTAGHERGGRTWSLEEYADWVSGLLAALELERVLLVGHSDSGGVALLTGLVCAERLAGVVLANTIGADGSRSFADVLAGLAVCAPLEMRYALRLLPRFAYNIWHHTRNFFRQFVGSVRRDLRAEARRLNVPALVAWGALDFVMPLSCATTLMRRLPDAELYVSARGSHDWLAELPEEFARAVEGFARRLRSLDSQREGTGGRVMAVKRGGVVTKDDHAAVRRTEGAWVRGSAVGVAGAGRAGATAGARATG